jgi:tetratricopeptide (TPR) repeat protein
MRERGKLEEADTLIRRAVALDRQIFGDRHGFVAAGLNNLATAARMRGNNAEAARLGEEAVDIARAVYPGANKETAVYLSGVGNSLFAVGDLPGATSAFRESLAQYRASLGEQHLFTQTVAVNLVRVLLEQGDVAGSSVLLEGALTALDSTVSSNRSLRLAAQMLVGRVTTLRGDARTATPRLERTEAATRETFGATHWRTAEAELALAASLVAVGDLARAVPLLRDAVQVLEPQERAQGRLLIAARRALDNAQSRALSGR